MFSHSPSANKMRRGTLLLSGLMILGILLTACGGGQTQAPKQQSALTIGANASGDYTRNFNPYSSNADTGTQGLIYETLMYYNRLTGSVQPWLAESQQLSSDKLSVTYHLRQGVKWSDGQAFSSNDVVFTLNLLKKYPDLDVNGIWSFIKGVTAPDSNTVVVTLSSVFTPILWYLGGQTYIVPQHLWSSVKGDPSQYANANPIGTGPYLLKSFTPQNYVFTKNPSFWQPGKPVVNELRFPAYSSNTSAELVLDQGKMDWGAIYAPNLQQTYVARDPAHNHFWFPASDVVMLEVNLTKYPYNLLPVRQAISDAIDRDQLSKVGESGYEPVASPTSIMLPLQKNFLNPAYADTTFSVDDAKATQLLESAGFTKGSDGFYADKNGKKLAFGIDVVEGYTDWITDCQLMSSNLKAVGIKATVNVISPDAYSNALAMGSFDVAMVSTNAGPSPYYLYDGLLRSTNSAPIGQQAASNYERWNDATTDKLLNEYATTTDTSVQQQALDGIQQIMVEQMPAIPLMNEPYWYEYDTAHFSGWPTLQDPYAVPAPYMAPDDEVVLLNLRPA